MSEEADFQKGLQRLITLTHGGIIYVTFKYAPTCLNSLRRVWMCFNLSQYLVEGGPFAGVFIPALGHQRQTLCGSFVQTHQRPAERRRSSEPLQYLCTQTERETDGHRERHKQTDSLVIYVITLTLTQTCDRLGLLFSRCFFFNWCTKQIWDSFQQCTHIEGQI